MNELKLTGLTKKFKGITAVRDVSYTMTTGVYGLLGVNGAGKTTLMRMLCTLLQPTEGTVLWDGENIFQMKERYRRLLGYLPQEFGYYPEFTVYDYLMYIASIKGLGAGAAKHRIKILLEQVGMEKAEKKKMKTLSGGMKRRVGIAQAMLGDPRILILDEPTAGLDPNERIRFRNLISELSQERLVLLSTHIVSDVEYIANEILLMKEGSVQVSGTLEQLLSGMPEQVWSIHTTKKEAEAYRRKYKVSNVKTLPEGINLRVLALERPCENAVLESPALEDLFLTYFGESVGENHDSL